MNYLKLWVLMLLIASCGQEKLEEGTFRLTGYVSGMTDGQLYLRNFPNTDTIEVKNGSFEMKGAIKEQVSRVFICSDVNAMAIEDGTSLFIEPANMELTIDVNDWDATKLKGSKTQDEKYKLEAITNKIATKYQKEQDAFDVVYKKYREAASAGASKEELEAIKEEDYIARGNLEPMWAEQKAAALQFIKENPKSYVSMDRLLYMLGDMKYKDAKAIVDQCNPEHLKTAFGKRLVKDVEDMQKGVPGAIAANFDTVDINGEPIKLADFKGQYVLIDFWASWCVPCRKGNPHLISLYKKYHPKGLEIIGVSSDDDNPDAWKKAVEKDGIGIWHHVLRGLEYKKGTYEQINIDKDISEGYNIHTLPTKILIDPEGIIVGRYGGGGEDDEAMDKKLEEIFAKG